jgi:predicted DsbA family dithiol-disulfide isomerase
MEKVTVEVIHDLVCSWCPIGRSNLIEAIKVLGKQIEVEIKYLPFELNPDMSPVGETIEAHLMRRNAWTKQQFINYRTDLTGVAKEAGLIYDFSKRTHYYNTAKAHRLVHFAQMFKKQDVVVDALTEQYFTQGMNLSEDKNLLDIATSVGLDRDQTERSISSSGDADISEDIQHKYDRVRELGMGSVPAFIINGTEFVRGVNSVEFFVRYLSRLGKISQSKVELVDNN